MTPIKILERKIWREKLRLSFYSTNNDLRLYTLEFVGWNDDFKGKLTMLKRKKTSKGCEFKLRERKGSRS